jgi:type VI secretion system ImpB/VipA family protein
MAASGAKFISRNRAPRVQIEYDVETNAANRRVRLPFVVGVMADLSGSRSEANMPAPVGRRDFLEIDAFNFNNRMKQSNPHAKFTVPNRVTGGPDLEIDIDFKNMDDFSPDRAAEKVGALKLMLDARKKLEGLKAYLDGKTRAEELIQKALADDFMLKKLITAGSAEPETPQGPTSPSYPLRSETMSDTSMQAAPQESAPATLDLDVFNEMLMQQLKPRTEKAKDLIYAGTRALAEQALADSKTRVVPKNAIRTIENYIVAIDEVLGKQLNLILHHPEFQRVESAWRGLHYLVSWTETDEMLKIKVLNVSKDEVARSGIPSFCTSGCL